ncbi:MAG TPA: tetratricopeptide repeat protein, partial [Polyangia bacterium]|nr:tetratricopeptide repeat protein [Polyangia bacterium]
MKITCERCSAQYDLDESRIPPSGMMMKCPACLHSFAVRRQSSSGMPAVPPAPVVSNPPPRKREIEVSTFEDDEGPTVLPPSAPGMIALDGPGDIDLPAPKEDFIDLPAPKERSRKPSIPPPRQRTATNPPPRPKVPTPAPFEHDHTYDETAFPSGPLPGLGPDEIDLPAPVDPGRRQDIVDLPAPKSGVSARPLSLADENIDLAELPAPKERGPQVGISLDAPDPEDLELHDSLNLGPPELDLDAIDVVAPRDDRPELPAPRQEVLDVAPRQETLDVAPRKESTDVAPRKESTDVAPRAAKPAAEPAAERPRQSQPRQTKAQAAAKTKIATEVEPRRRWGRVAAALGGVVLLLGGVGIALGVFTGFGQKLLRGGASARQEQQLNVARNQMTDDTLGAYRKAAAAMTSLLEVDPTAFEAGALAAQAQLGAAHLGVAAGLREADAQLAKLTDEKAAQLPDVLKARALRSSVAGLYPDARNKLAAVLAKAPADSAALVYLGWTELAAGDPAAADKAFAKALAAEPSRAQALYGDGVAKERLGDTKGASDLYQRAQSRSPLHMGAAVGLARTTKPPAEAQAAVEELLKSRATTAAPRELADGWATVGVLAEKSGRHDEAEDRLKRALALDPDHAIARVALANVQCGLKRCADAVAPMEKLVAAQPKNVAAKLALAQAQLGTGAIADAAGTLGAAATLAPKSADVLFVQARLALAQPKIDREGALAKLKDAIVADPKLIPAYILESTTLGALDRQDDAVAALQAAEKQAADSADLMTQLGDAYLALGKPVEAEMRYRAALSKQPDARPARMALGAALEAENKLDDARAEYEHVAKDDAQ